MLCAFAPFAIIQPTGVTPARSVTTLYSSVVGRSFDGEVVRLLTRLEVFSLSSASTGFSTTPTAEARHPTIFLFHIEVLEPSRLGAANGRVNNAILMTSKSCPRRAPPAPRAPRKRPGPRPGKFRSFVYTELLARALYRICYRKTFECARAALPRILSDRALCRSAGAAVALTAGGTARYQIHYRDKTRKPERNYECRRRGRLGAGGAGRADGRARGGRTCFGCSYPKVCSQRLRKVSVRMSTGVDGGRLSARAERRLRVTSAARADEFRSVSNSGAPNLLS
ncbi:hypothetical protein EVAR_9991_1 [Eumeta japonica]|uniref:Uncharacterized protein n=1 Tax=Eumeta variegata TaxID=151549 RepID=A0A4C1TQZ6_EUMVA|nr:hypothetical protein EVAR_9991_1 [Eumeta japonica]